MPRRRLVLDRWPSTVYAIGDVHGCLSQLKDIEQQILADGDDRAGDRLIITLGDYVDRGPASAQVIDHLLEPLPRGWQRVALTGNHEQMMLDYLHDPSAAGWWLIEGGAETARSYGVEIDAALRGGDPEHALRSALLERIPERHLEFLETLPVAVSLPGWLFVHAGIRPGLPLAAQSDEDLAWIRAPFLDASRQDGLVVVHGHTPGREPVVRADRIGIDTHCFATGRLTALRVTADGERSFLTATGPARG